MDTTASPSTQMTATSPHLSPPWGRYRYKTAPQGFIASGDGYSRRFDEIVSHIPNKTKYIDDTLFWANNLTESFYQTTSADATASPLIRTSSYLVKTLSNSRDSRSPPPIYGHAKSSSMQSATSRPPPT